MISVLMIDDETDTHKLFLKYFSKDPYEFLYAQNIEEAFVLLSNHSIKLIVLDFLFETNDETPQNPLGLRHLGTLSTKFPHIPIIILTNYPKYPNPTKALKSGALDVIAKTDRNKMNVIKNHLIEIHNQPNKYWVKYFTSKLPDPLSYLLEFLSRETNKGVCTKLSLDLIEALLRLGVFVTLLEETIESQELHFPKELAQPSLGTLYKILQNKLKKSNGHFSQAFTFFQDRSLRKKMEKIIQYRNIFVHRPSIIDNDYYDIKEFIGSQLVQKLVRLSQFELALIDSIEFKKSKNLFLTKYTSHKGVRSTFFPQNQLLFKEPLQSGLFYLIDTIESIALPLDPFIISDQSDVLNMMLPFHYNHIEVRNDSINYHNYYTGEKRSTPNHIEF